MMHCPVGVNCCHYIYLLICVVLCLLLSVFSQNTVSVWHVMQHVLAVAQLFAQVNKNWTIHSQSTLLFNCVTLDVILCLTTKVFLLEGMYLSSARS